MNSFSSSHMRSRRNFLDLNGFAPVHLPTSVYCTDAQAKSDKMKCTIEDDIFKNLHLLPDPLKKNLADSVITGETLKKNAVETKERKTHEAVKPPTTQRTDYYPSLSGITSFFSGVFNIMGTIFQKRTSSPVSQYYDCFDNEYNDQMAPPMFWQPSNFEVRNKNESDMPFGSNNDSRTNLDVEMNSECKAAIAQCEEKLNQVRSLLCKKNDQNVPKARGSPRKPRKAFVEAGSVEESFEDAFSESVLSLANDTFVECCAPFKSHDELLIQSDAPRIKTDFYVTENMNITKNLPEETESERTEVKQNLNTENLSNCEMSVTKTKGELVSSCEDKLNKIKELLRSRHCKTSKSSEPIPISTENKIETLFGNEMNSSDLLTSSSSQDSDHFNEITGRFNSSSVDSEDSFQIVFTDSPRKCRRRIPSECESEDSFIVFEESPDSCYTSNEVFGEEILGNDSSDSDSDSDSDVDDDSGCGVQCKLSPSLSRTFGNLTDDSLYDQDVVDSASVSSPSTTTPWLEKMGLLLDENRKSEKKKNPTKRVHFSTEPPKVHIMRVWAFAARQARAGHWERHALDRERFKRRIADVEMAISWVLKPQHRTRVVFQRFMPWWNAQKRKELAEKKEAEEAEKRRMIEECKNNASHESSNNCDKSIPEVVENGSNDPNLNKDETKIVVNDYVDNNITHEVKISRNIVNKDDTTKLSQNQNYRDQSVNTQVNDSYEKIDKISDIDDSITIKSNEEPLTKNGLLIKNCCIDT